jgi:septal ring factor EnvC (AmiA/AmiB activator)
MARHYKVLGFLLVALLGAYGCAKGPGSAASTESNSTTTVKAQKLEEDYRAAIAARDQLRQKLVAAEEQQAKAQRELEQARAAAATEREALKNELKARTGERDAVNAQFETFRKNLKDLLGNADTAVGALNLPAPKPSADQGAQK